jgi:hypothetical protein
MVLSCNPLTVVPLLGIAQADKYTRKYGSTLPKYQIMKLHEGVQIKLCSVYTLEVGSDEIWDRFALDKSDPGTHCKVSAVLNMTTEKRCSSCAGDDQPASSLALIQRFRLSELET